MSDGSNILVVDDTPANLDLLESILGGRDYEVRKIPNGPLALISARAAAPDLILLDVKMPGMDGYEVCARLKEAPATRDIPVIFISALQETQDKIRAFTAGGVDYITKPFQAEEVVARVETHLRLYRLQREMAQARSDAEAANRAKSAFLANMSHELRTPLNAMLGFAQVLEHDPRLLKEQQGHVAGIGRGGRYLLTLINDLLDLAKVEAGRFELVAADWQPDAFFQEIVAMFRLKAEEKGLEIRYPIPSPELPRTLRSDDRRLRQVLMNLLGNAVKFTSQGVITLRTGFTEGRLRVDVEDQGVGISREELVYIFEPFRQAGGSAYKAQGTGLGLAISQRLVELMRGEISVESAPGQGSRFRIEIPVETVADLADAPQPRVVSPPVIGYLRGAGEGPLRILVNDPVVDNRDSLCALLEQLGFETLAVAAVEECLQALRSWRPDLILTEIRLKETDGLALIETLRGDPAGRAVPIIALTASVFEEDRAAALDAGCAAYLTKPLVRSELTAALGRELALEWRHAEAGGTQEMPVAYDRNLSQEQWGVIRDWLKRGDIAAIQAYLAGLSREPGCPVIVNELLELAGRFDLGALRVRVEAGLREGL